MGNDIIRPFKNQYPAGLYIHWPFCTSRCSYCDFVALEQHEHFSHDYHKALCNEITTFFDSLTPQGEIETIYFGGGTPSLYPDRYLEELFEIIWQKGTVCSHSEITIEANPADITQQKLNYWKYLGINRLSLGIQCLDDVALQKVNRRQTVDDAYRAISLAQDVFDNISVDLILGLPGVDEKSWFEKTLATIVQWPITHVSLYFLTVYEKTPLYFAIQRKDVILPDPDVMVDWYERSIDYLERYGFLQYEISNFAKNGFCSKHNKAYWDRKPYKGFGLGASSFDGVIRCSNAASLTDYINNCLQKHPLIPYTFEILTERQILLEELMLSLRQTCGVDLQRVVYFLKSDEKEKLRHTMSSLENAGFVKQENNRVRLTRKGMVLENEIVIRLLHF